MDYATSDGTATETGDYAPASGSVSFAPGETSQTVSVSVNGDTTHEADETFTVDLSNPTNATILDGQGLGTMTNDDGVAQCSIGDLAHSEGDSGTSSFDFTVSLSNPSDQTVSVDYTTNNGTASAPSDYNPASVALTLAPGQTSQSVSVAAKGENTNRANETLTAALTNAANPT